MSAWSGNVSPEPVLRGAAGELVSVRITVDPRLLEDLLDALAAISFPINPKIYHQAVVVGLSAEGRRESRAATMVEFPAYRNDLEQVRQSVAAAGLDASSVGVRSMLENIQSAASGCADVPWLIWQN